MSRLAMMLPGSRPRREDFTSASSHPELSLGYLAIPPRIDVSVSSEEHRSIGRWSRRMLASCVAIAAIMLAFPLVQQTLSTAGGLQASERVRSAPCAAWDDAASEAIVDLVRARRDADLRLVGDAVFRMRRARRNCHMGWTRLACLDYQAIINGAPALAEGFQPAAFACSSPDGESIGTAVRRFTPAETRTANRP
jgi:hypothetical protein